MQLRVTAPVRPTEEAAKVEEAILNLFPGMAIEHAADRLTGTGGDLQALRSRIWELRIIDAFRGQALYGTKGPTFRVVLSKQAALARKVSIPPRPHALGELELEATVEASDLWSDAERLVWWLCPETKDGEIVGPH